MGSILSMQWPISSAKRTRHLPPAMLVAAGALHQCRGRIAVIRGTLLHNDILRAQGYRQQLVGMLQRFWKRGMGRRAASPERSAATREVRVARSCRHPNSPSGVVI